ncbi:MAG: ABC transporter ATP-binding protein [Devosia sp.]|nr:ABC transporter ATP-binding protein [Devosia sp.]
MILRLAGLSKRFGAVVVADNIDLDVARGEALGIIGANGAGKSSLFNLITGVVIPDSGTVVMDGKDLTNVSLRNRCVAGIGRSFQIPRPFESLTVFENLLVAAEYGRGRGALGATELCGSILERTGLASHANTLGGKLTLLNRKRLEMARALATQPDIVLLDEIAGGLTEAECSELVAFIKQVNQEGVTIVWIEHVVHALLSVVSRLVVLEFGRKIADGEPSAVMADPAVRRSYLGIEDEVAA